MTQDQNQVVILGAGPAGLSAGLELLRKTDKKVLILEKGSSIGGLARSYAVPHGVIDLGGHRFHSKSKRVHDFWRSLDPDRSLFSERERRSLLKFDHLTFEFPVSVNVENLRKLGLKKSLGLFRDYCFRPQKSPRSLRDFYLRNYGEGLTKLFFDHYTEKVWGRKSEDIHMDWGPERLAPLSFSVERKTFLYPKGGPGAFWDRVGDEVKKLGGDIRMGVSIDGLTVNDGLITGVDTDQGHFIAHHIISTLPMDQISKLTQGPQAILPRRSLVSVNVALKRGDVQQPSADCPQWIYLHSRGVKASRAQFYRAWDSSLVPSPEVELVGVEYFCDRGDQDWQRSESDWEKEALSDLRKSGLIETENCLASYVFKAPDAYPCAWEDKASLQAIKSHLFGIRNLRSVGRHGQHRYMNMDYAMLTGLLAVDQLRLGGAHESIWADIPEIHAPE